MKVKAYALISIGFVWLSALVWCLWKAQYMFAGMDYTVAITRTTLFSWLMAALLFLIMALTIVVLLVGWIVPLYFGFRTLKGTG
jgi:hypothetical protein